MDDCHFISFTSKQPQIFFFLFVLTIKVINAKIGTCIDLFGIICIYLFVGHLGPFKIRLLFIIPCFCELDENKIEVKDEKGRKEENNHNHVFLIYLNRPNPVFSI